MTRHFELLNYSEHGTTVDNVLFSCDFSDKPSSAPVTSPIVGAVREIISKGSGRKSKSKNVKSDVETKRKTEDDKPRMRSRADKVSQWIHGNSNVHIKGKLKVKFKLIKNFF